jgi:hypothetical protein
MIDRMIKPEIKFIWGTMNTNDYNPSFLCYARRFFWLKLHRATEKLSEGSHALRVSVQSQKRRRKCNFLFRDHGAGFSD